MTRIPTEDDMLRIFRFVEEMQRFLHQPANYDNNPKVIAWLQKRFGPHILSFEMTHLYHHMLPNFLSAETLEKIENEDDEV